MIRAYYRVSTRKQAREGNGIEAQQKSVKSFCKNVFPDLKIVDYIDDGISGVVPFEEREAGKRLMNDIRQGDYVISKDPSRFGRKCLICVNLIELVEGKGGIIANSLSGNIVNDPDSKFMFHLFSALAEKDYTMLVTNMEQGKKVKAEKGGNVGGGVPFYMESSKDGEHYTPTIKGMTTLGLMIDMFEKGKSGKEIAQSLGFSPSTVSKYKKKFTSGELNQDYKLHKHILQTGK